MATTRAALARDERRPEVIVDFACRDGLLFVILKNIGARSAYRVTTRFDKPFRGLGGRKPIATLRLFRRLDFMAPGVGSFGCTSAARGWRRVRGSAPAEWDPLVLCAARRASTQASG